MPPRYNFYGYRVAPRNEKPVALISPEDEQTNSLGSIIKLDGRRSYDPEGATITYRWSLTKIPLGSKVTDSDLIYLEDDFSVVTFLPDRIGAYELQLIVNDGVQDSDPALSVVNIQLSLVPLCNPTAPDASWIWGTLSDFWSFVADREWVEDVWSALIQIVGSEVLRLYQLDYNKSIRDIQDYVRRRWLPYSARWDFEDDEYPYLVIGNQDYGVDAATGSLGLIGTGALIGNREILMVEGAASPKYVGSNVDIMSSASSPGNVGTYEITGIGPSSQTYVLSALTPLPSIADEVLLEAFNAATTAGSTEVSIPGAALLSLSPTPEPGDVLKVFSGADAGYYRIDTLTDDAVFLTQRMKATAAALHIQILNSVDLEIGAVNEGDFTDTISVPLATDPDDITDLGLADFTTLNTSEISGIATIIGAREVLVPDHLVFDDAPGRTLVVRSGTNRGEYTISGINATRTGYLCTSANFTGEFPQTAVSITIRGVRASAGRIIVIGNRAYTISRVYNETARMEPRTVAVISQKSLAPSLQGRAWRIPATLVTQSNLEDLGVRAGDQLMLEITRSDTQKTAEYPVAVLGVDENRLGFEMSVGPFSASEPGSPTEEEILSLVSQLGLEGANKNLITNQWEYSDEVAEVAGTIQSEGFANKFFNVPISETTIVDLGLFTVSIKPTYIIRNSLIPVDTEVASIPCLCEFIQDPELTDDQVPSQVLMNGEVEELGFFPVCLRENADYVLESDSEIYGSDATIVAGSSSIYLPRSDLFGRRVEVGDTIIVTDSVAAGDYSIVEVVDEENAIIYPTPIASDDDARYVIVRRVPGRFLRFYGYYTPRMPAPDRLWAENTFFDNGQAIEDNFGYMVGLSRQDLLDIGSELSYKSAVSGLMYSWAHGPTLKNVELGAQILLGFPYADTDGYITEIRNDYQTDEDGFPILGRMLFDEVRDGERTGIIRAFFYPPHVTETDPDTGQLIDITDPLTTGLADNPDTGQTWAEGDFVPQYSVLTKGVRVRDYVDEPDWFVMGGVSLISEVEKFHSFQILTNASLVDTNDTSFVYEFARAIKPVWTKLVFVVSKWFRDDVIVEDDFSLNVPYMLYDTPGFGIEACIREDNFNEASLLNAPLESDTLRTITLEIGSDLRTTNGSPVVQISQGVVYPLPFAKHGAPTMFPGDILYILEGPNTGKYVIDDIPVDLSNDTDIELYTTPEYFTGRNPLNFETLENQRYQVMRRVSYTPVEFTAVSCVLNSPIVTLDLWSNLPFAPAPVPIPAPDLFQAGVMADDVLLIGYPGIGPSLNQGRYRIKSISSSGSWPIPGGNFQQDVLEVEPLDWPPNPPWWTGTGMVANSGGAPGTAEFARIVRESLLANPIEILGASPAVSAAGRYLTYGTDRLAQSVIRPGDEFWQFYNNPVVDDRAVMGLRFRVLDVDFTTGRIYVSPPPTLADEGSPPELVLVRPNKRWLNGRWWFYTYPVDRHEYQYFSSDLAASKVLRDLPEDVIEVSIQGTTLSIVNGSDTVSLVGQNVNDLNINAGDWLDILSGVAENGSSIVVIEVAPGAVVTDLRVSRNLTGTEAPLDYRIRRVKR